MSLISEQDNAKAEEDIKYVFAVVPETVTLQAKMGIFIQFRANSFSTGLVDEEKDEFVVEGGYVAIPAALAVDLT